MVADIITNKNLNQIIIELLIIGRKLNISSDFIKQSYFAVSKNYTHYFIMKIPNKRELPQTAFNHSSDIDFRDLINPYNECTAKPC